MHVLAGGTTDLAGIAGHRLDGWPNRDLQPGTIISLSRLAVATDRTRQDLACVVNRYDEERTLGLDDAQRVDLVEYLKSL